MGRAIVFPWVVTMTMMDCKAGGCMNDNTSLEAFPCNFRLIFFFFSLGTDLTNRVIKYWKMANVTKRWCEDKLRVRSMSMWTLYCRQCVCCARPCKLLPAIDTRRWFCVEEKQSVGSLEPIIHAPANVCMQRLPRTVGVFWWLSECNPPSSC